jgi:hypothetical protein
MPLEALKGPFIFPFCSEHIFHFLQAEKILFCQKAYEVVRNSVEKLSGYCLICNNYRTTLKSYFLKYVPQA